MCSEKTPKAISDDELFEVAGGKISPTLCDKCTEAEFPKEGACFGSWSDGKLFSCGCLTDNGRFMKCVKCGFCRNS